MQTLVMIVLMLGISQAQIDWPQMKEKIDTFVNELLECKGFIGMNLAIVKDGETQYTAGYGYADLENQVPNDGETIHQIQSISKSIAVTLFATVIEETGISWDSLITDLLPTFRFRDEVRNKALKLRDLLGHVTGFPEILNGPSDTKEEFIEVVQCSEPVMTLRESFCYVDENYFLAGVILEYLTGKPYTQLVNERIYGPLKMNSSFPSYAGMQDDSLGKWAYSYYLKDGEVTRRIEPVGDNDLFELKAPAFGAMTTAEDMAEYMKFHLGAYRNDGSTNPVVDPEILREMYKSNQAIGFFTSFLEIDGLEDFPETWRIYDYGMGFWNGNYRDTDLIQHGGYSGPKYPSDDVRILEHWHLYNDKWTS